MTRVFCAALAICAMPAAAAPVASAVSPEPRVELGIGGIALGVPDYRGSDRYGAQVYPIPYLAYRSERVQVTREGFRARLFAAERLTLSVSAALNLPGNDDNPDRAGMPRIEPTFEAGPSLDYRLDDDGDGPRWRLRLPLRAAVAADGLELKAIGYVAVPHVRADYRRPGRVWDALYIASLGAVWASEDYHEYFYGVAPVFADPASGRPAYDAHGGYNGMRVNLSASFQRDRWRAGTFASYDALGGAIYTDSPLVKTEHSVLAGVYVTYRLFARGRPIGLEDDAP